MGKFTVNFKNGDRVVWNGNKHGAWWATLVLGQVYTIRKTRFIPDHLVGIEGEPIALYYKSCFKKCITRETVNVCLP